MPVARKQIVDPNVTPWYHCISRCVRRAFLRGGGNAHRKGWIESRLEFLSQVFALNVGAFSAMDNHLHVLLRLDREQAEVKDTKLSFFLPKRLLDAVECSVRLGMGIVSQWRSRPDGSRGWPRIPSGWKQLASDCAT